MRCTTACVCGLNPVFPAMTFKSSTNEAKVTDRAIFTTVKYLDANKITIGYKR